MNPWIQSFKFDRNAQYIKKWIPELTDVDPDDIHKWHESCHLSKYKHICSLYTKPIVIYEIEKQKTQEIIY
jgi:deoxyribodipyrimidine photo-lyase